MSRRRTRSPEPVDCTCKVARHEHGTVAMYGSHRCGCDPCFDEYTRHQKAIGRRAQTRDAPSPARDSEHAPTVGEFVASFPFYGGMSGARARRIALEQMIEMVREQDITVTGNFIYQFERGPGGAFLTVRAPAESSRSTAEITASAVHMAEQREQAHPALARWITQHLEGVAA